jgi:hypothetical protein
MAAALNADGWSVIAVDIRKIRQPIPVTHPIERITFGELHGALNIVPYAATGAEALMFLNSPCFDVGTLASELTHLRSFKLNGGELSKGVRSSPVVARVPSMPTVSRHNCLEQALPGPDHDHRGARGGSSSRENGVSSATHNAHSVSMLRFPVPGSSCDSGVCGWGKVSSPGMNHRPF